MATSLYLPLADYLQTTYHPDREYLDGELLERNVGKWEHSRIQALLTIWFGAHERTWQVMTATEARMQVSATRIRIPDIMVVSNIPQPEVVVEPPVVAIEIFLRTTPMPTRNGARKIISTWVLRRSGSSIRRRVPARDTRAEAGQRRSA